MNKQETLKQMAVQLLFNKQATYNEKRKLLAGLHDFFVSCGAEPTLVNGELTNGKKSGQWLDAGWAISPHLAGFCLFDIERTCTFARGVHDALKDVSINDSTRPLQVVYAGSGPYALLAMLAVPFFKPRELEFTLIDIHEASLASVQRLVSFLGLQPFFKEYVCTDAVTYKWPGPAPLHAIISETMQVGLRREPQVFISANLVKQLMPGGILIPQQIEVRASVSRVDVEKRMNKLPGEDKLWFPLGVVADLTKETAELLASGEHTEEFELPSEARGYDYEIYLDTHIQVWNQNQLKLTQSGLTMPLSVSKPGDLRQASALRFTYKKYPKPGVYWEPVSKRQVSGRTV